MSSPSCPLCETVDCMDLGFIEQKRFHQCDQCRLIFLDPSMRLSPEQEKARYLLHENHVDDPGYRTFLSPILEEVLKRFPMPVRGLDFGSGPGPALAKMFDERSYPVDIYDPYFSPNPKVFQQTYDFITCTEVAEHLYQPYQEFSTLVPLLRNGGILAILTSMFENQKDFATSHYHRDPTHVCFFGKATFTYLAQKLGQTVAFPRPNVALLIKSNQ
ncbi:MAG: methyltransferase domain-containing protein [Bdellovibrionota bacterium]